MSTDALISEPCQQWLDKFLLHLQVERGLSLHTIKNYKRQLTEVAKLLGLYEWSGLTPSDIKRVMADAKMSGHSPRSIALRLSALRTFCQYLIEHQQLFSNPVEGIQAPKQGKPLPKQLSVDEMQQLLNASPQSSDEDEGMQLRDVAMFELLYGCGLRLSELTGLNLADCLKDGTVKVMGKGSKQRILPLGRHAQKALTHGLKCDLLTLRLMKARYLLANAKPVFLTDKWQIDSTKWLKSIRCRKKLALTNCAIPSRHTY